MARLLDHVAQSGNHEGAAAALDALSNSFGRPLVASMFQNPDTARVIIPLCTPEELEQFIPTMSNEIRMLVLEHTTRAAVMRGLAASRDLSDELREIFLAKANRVALRRAAGDESPRSPEFRIAAWTRLVEKFGELELLPGLDPADWTRDRIYSAFTTLCENQPKLINPSKTSFVNQARVTTLWRMAELAGVVSDEQRELWLSFASLGPQRFYDERGIVREGTVPANRFRNEHIVQFVETSDVSYLLDLDTVTGDDIQEIADYLPVNRYLPLSPRFAELLDLCDDSALAWFVRLGALPLSDALGRSVDLRSIVEKGGGALWPYTLPGLTVERVLQLSPLAALDAAMSGQSPAALEDVYAYLAEELEGFLLPAGPST